MSRAKRCGREITLADWSRTVTSCDKGHGRGSVSQEGSVWLAAARDTVHPGRESMVQ